MESWDLVLLVVAGYVAAVTLARLMIRRRDQMLEQFRKELDNKRREKKKDAGRRQPPDRRVEAA